MGEKEVIIVIPEDLERKLKETGCIQRITIDIPEDLEPDLKETCWIQRVPRKLRKVNEAAYTPNLVSIGPFHYGRPGLEAMEHRKSLYCQKFWERDFCKHTRKKDIGDFPWLRIRNMYAGTFDQLVLNDDFNHFSNVILRDCCFIFELFLRNYENAHDENNENPITDYILRTPWLRKAIELDLIMLENQLPYFVLTELFDFILDSQPDYHHHLVKPRYLSKHSYQNKEERADFIIEMTGEFFCDYYFNGKSVDEEKKDGEGLLNSFTRLLHSSKEPPKDESPSSSRPKEDENGKSLDEEKKDGEGLLKCLLCSSKEPPLSKDESKPTEDEMKRFKKTKHFTDLVRRFLLPKKYADSNNTNCRYSAKELDRAGVHFSPCKNKSLADIQKKEDNKLFSWNSLTLEIPKFMVEDNTECLMRNVMALEQCLYPHKAHICNYIALLDQLIDTVEDVELLINKKVVDNWLGSNEAVVKLINGLSDEIVETSFCYGNICEQLNDLHESLLQGYLDWQFYCSCSCCSYILYSLKH